MIDDITIAFTTKNTKDTKTHGVGIGIPKRNAPKAQNIRDIRSRFARSRTETDRPSCTSCPLW